MSEGLSVWNKDNQLNKKKKKKQFFRTENVLKFETDCIRWNSTSISLSVIYKDNQLLLKKNHRFKQFHKQVKSPVCSNNFFHTKFRAVGSGRLADMFVTCNVKIYVLSRSILLYKFKIMTACLCTNLNVKTGRQDR